LYSILAQLLYVPYKKILVSNVKKMNSNIAVTENTDVTVQI